MFVFLCYKWVMCDFKVQNNGLDRSCLVVFPTDSLCSTGFPTPWRSDWFQTQPLSIFVSNLQRVTAPLWDSFMKTDLLTRIQTERRRRGRRQDRKHLCVFVDMYECAHLCVCEKGGVQGTSSALCEVMGELKLRGRSGHWAGSGWAEVCVHLCGVRGGANNV